MHFNINSYQNKFEELKLINQTAQASIIILTETKIDSSYPNSQFKMTNYRLHRNDRKKRGGGILAYVRSGLGARRLATSKAYKTLEPLVLDVNQGGKDIVLVGLYRTPTRNTEPNYFSQLKDELINLITWAIARRDTLILMSDLNLDKLKPHKIEYKILKDIEEIFDLACLIKRATRVTATSRSLIDIILTNTEDLFESTGVLEFGVSDHRTIYRFLRPKVKRHASKIISFRSTKNLDSTSFRNDMSVEMKKLDLDPTIPASALYQQWNTAVTKVIDKHMPIRKMCVTEKDALYMTTT